MSIYKVFNIVGFQISWWICVLSATTEMAYLGPLVMATFIIIHFWKFTDSINELKLIAIFGVLGTIVDTMFMHLGLLSYDGLYSKDILIAPLWITAMWCGFSATINHSMYWLNNKWMLSFVLGLVFGPLSYITGEKFGAISFTVDIKIIIVVLAIVWGLSIPSIYWVNNKLDN